MLNWTTSNSLRIEGKLSESWRKIATGSFQIHTMGQHQLSKKGKNCRINIPYIRNSLWEDEPRFDNPLREVYISLLNF